MIQDVLSERIRELHPTNALEQENALQEAMQCYVLAALARSRFFSRAEFQGGTCLRILYGMNRFSEDLDFLLRKPDPEFEWQRYLNRVRDDCADEGIPFELQDRSETDRAVKKAFLKTDSVGKVLLLDLPFSRRESRKIRIKLEIDTNPPAGSTREIRYLTFPVTAAITTQTLESGFATKSHALLCRSYTKGRDWYDFVWYVGKRVVPSYGLLANALAQVGPWAGERVEVTRAWYLAALAARIREVDWAQARADVMRFVPAREQEGLRAWGEDFFAQCLARLAEYLPA
jgi:predicted nucleotidyltransferase component of viral defense system